MKASRALGHLRSHPAKPQRFLVQFQADTLSRLDSHLRSFHFFEIRHLHLLLYTVQTFRYKFGEVWLGFEQDIQGFEDLILSFGENIGHALLGPDHLNYSTNIASPIDTKLY